MAELSDGVARVIEVHERSELVLAIKQAACSGGKIVIDTRLQLYRHDIARAAWRAGLYNPRTGYIGPVARHEFRSNVVCSITYTSCR